MPTWRRQTLNVAGFVVMIDYFNETGHDDKESRIKCWNKFKQNTCTYPGDLED
jgi:hypothetical protein